jgi:hypothetical protein
MSFDLKLPNITAPTDAGKVEQIRSYLYQLTEQLKWALNSIESSNGGHIVQTGNQSGTKELSEAEAQATFNSIKSLIINSAEIVEAYSEKISKTLSGEYVAKSDFGEYTEHTTQTINADSKNVESLYRSIQEIVSDIDNLEHSIIEVNAHIKSGLLYTDDKGVPIYGLEVGQINEIDGEEVFNKFARFTSDRLSFYDKNDTEIAYISDYKLYITNAHITGTLTLGRFVCDTSNGLAIKWV